MKRRRTSAAAHEDEQMVVDANPAPAPSTTPQRGSSTSSTKVPVPPPPPLSGAAAAAASSSSSSSSFPSALQQLSESLAKPPVAPHPLLGSSLSGNLHSSPIALIPDDDFVARGLPPPRLSSAPSSSSLSSSFGVSPGAGLSAGLSAGAGTGVESSPLSSIFSIPQFAAHVTSLRIDVVHRQLRQTLQKLINHPQNKAGLFSVPVDPVALGLLDYDIVIKEKMDLGTIKKRLHACYYDQMNLIALSSSTPTASVAAASSPSLISSASSTFTVLAATSSATAPSPSSSSPFSVPPPPTPAPPAPGRAGTYAHFARDVRLTFQNAMRYNPPHHSVHKAAAILLKDFEDDFAAIHWGENPFAQSTSLAPSSSSSQGFASSSSSSSAIAQRLPSLATLQSRSAKSQVVVRSASLEVGTLDAAPPHPPPMPPPPPPLGPGTPRHPAGPGVLALAGIVAPPQQQQQSQSLLSHPSPGRGRGRLGGGGRGAASKNYALYSKAHADAAKVLKEQQHQQQHQEHGAANEIGGEEDSNDTVEVAPSAAQEGAAEESAKAAEPSAGAAAAAATAAAPARGGHGGLAIVVPTPTTLTSSSSATSTTPAAASVLPASEAIVPFSSRPAPPPHNCPICLGRCCELCGERCLPLSPPILVCSGPCGTRIRRGTFFYAVRDGGCVWCVKCYGGLSGVISAGGSAIPNPRRSGSGGGSVNGDEDSSQIDDTNSQRDDNDYDNSSQHDDDETSNDAGGSSRAMDDAPPNLPSLLNSRSLSSSSLAGMVFDSMAGGDDDCGVFAINLPSQYAVAPTSAAAGNNKGKASNALKRKGSKAIADAAQEKSESNFATTLSFSNFAAAQYAPPPPPLLKRDLLKRRFDDDVPEPWIACKCCRRSFHRACVLYNGRGVGKTRKSGPPLLCPFCVFESTSAAAASASTPHAAGMAAEPHVPFALVVSPATDCINLRAGQLSQLLLAGGGVPSPAVSFEQAAAAAALAAATTCTPTFTANTRHGGASPGGNRLLAAGGGAGKVGSGSSTPRAGAAAGTPRGGSSGNSSAAAKNNITAAVFAAASNGSLAGGAQPPSLVLPTSTTPAGCAMIERILRGPSIYPPASSATSPSTNWTWVSGRTDPILFPSADRGAAKSGPYQTDFSAHLLPVTSLSDFIEAKVKDVVRTLLPEVESVANTITIREVSCVAQAVSPSPIIHANFSNVPATVTYLSRSIMLFQRIDNCDVALFSMYVQEYDADSSAGKRVYVAYLDSIEYFRPREIRSDVYHEMIVSYLAHARMRGFEKAHIWSCPPTKGNNFIFWAHPTHQRTPNRKILETWYHHVLARAVDMGVVTDIKSLYETFETFTQLGPNETPPCPPVLNGDHWLDEAVRLHRQVERRANSGRSGSSSGQPLARRTVVVDDKGVDVASMIKTRVVEHQHAHFFTKPVDPVALRLDDYFDIIKRPMDLGTVLRNLQIQKYERLSECVEDVHLVFSNAVTFNPPGHVVHEAAVTLRKLFDRELAILQKKWVGRLVIGRRNEHITSDVDLNDVKLKREEISIITGSSAGFGAATASAGGGASSSSAAASVASATAAAMAVANADDDDDDDDDEDNDGDGGVEGEDVDGASSSAAGAPLQGAENPPGRRARTAPTPGASTSKFAISNNLPAPNHLPYESRYGLLLSGGPSGISRLMLGKDYEHGVDDSRSKRGSSSRKKHGGHKKGDAARDREGRGPAKGGISLISAPKPSGQKDPSWLGLEVAKSIWKLRSDFFVCDLQPGVGRVLSQAERDKIKVFEDYCGDFVVGPNVLHSNPLLDHRHTFLEVCQFKHLQFNTLRHSKYSTSLLLYYLHRPFAPSLQPRCDQCKNVILRTRWHAAIKGKEEQELCGACITTKNEKDQLLYTPFRITNCS